MAVGYIIKKDISRARIEQTVQEDKLKKRLKENEIKRVNINKRKNMQKEILEIIDKGVDNPKDIIDKLKEKYPDVVDEIEKVKVTMPNGEKIGRLTVQILDKIKSRKLAQKEDEGR